MIRDLKFKPDFQRTIQRFAAWWQGEIVDRAPVSLYVRPQRRPELPAKTHATLRDRWLDVEYRVASAIAQMSVRAYIGDSLPVFTANIGPEISATLFGCELEFSESTSWSVPTVGGPEDWRRILAMKPDFDNVYWKTMERMTDYAISACEGRFLVGLTDLHGGYDMLAALRDPQMLCMDLMDDPDLVRQVGRHMSNAFNASFRRCYRQVSSAGFGSICWTPCYHEGPAYVPSCDFWCLLSPQMAREWIWPDIMVEMQGLERSIFHLDGPQALPHLDLLLSCPQLNAVQWVYGAGRGPASRWIDVYRRIRQAGKSLQLMAHDGADALNVLREIGPRGVWVCIAKPFKTSEEAEAFVRDVERLSRCDS